MSVARCQMFSAGRTNSVVLLGGMKRGSHCNALNQAALTSLWTPLACVPTKTPLWCVSHRLFVLDTCTVMHYSHVCRVCAVITFPWVTQVLREAARLCRPGGEILLLEHGRHGLGLWTHA